MLSLSKNLSYTVVLFDVITLESSALFHCSLPRISALLEQFLEDPPKLLRYHIFYGIHVGKMFFLMMLLSLVKRKKSHEARSVGREVAPAQ